VLIQLLGLVLLFWVPVGTLVGLILILWGGVGYRRETKRLKAERAAAKTK